MGEIAHHRGSAIISFLGSSCRLRRYAQNTSKERRSSAQGCAVWSLKKYILDPHFREKLPFYDRF